MSHNHNLLSDSELERYSRQIILPQMGGNGQRRLRGAHIIMLGAGGIGCAALPYLTAAGVGHITIIDADKVEMSNLHRQPLYDQTMIGKPKALMAQQYAQKLNPHIKYDALVQRIHTNNAHMILSPLLRNADAIIDGTDNFATRLLVNQYSLQHQVPLISAAIGQFQGQFAVFKGWEAQSPCYRCFVGDAFDNEDCDNCAELGVLGASVGIMGCLAAQEAVRLIAEAGTVNIGQLLLFDGLGPSMRMVKLRKDKNCSDCGGNYNND